MKSEEWKRIPNLEGYEASSFGRIRRRSGKIAKSFDGGSGYLRFNATVKGKQKCVSVHRSVAISFIGKPPKGHEVNHKNGVKTDNALKNLEFVTKAENYKHALGLGLLRPGGKNVLTAEEVGAIKFFFPRKKTTSGVVSILCKIFDRDRKTLRRISLAQPW